VYIHACQKPMDNGTGWYFQPVGWNGKTGSRVPAIRVLNLALWCKFMSQRKFCFLAGNWNVSAKVQGIGESAESL